MRCTALVVEISGARALSGCSTTEEVTGPQAFGRWVGGCLDGWLAASRHRGAPCLRPCSVQHRRMHPGHPPLFQVSASRGIYTLSRSLPSHQIPNGARADGDDPGLPPG
jgi:hypothetical protein